MLASHAAKQVFDTLARVYQNPTVRDGRSRFYHALERAQRLRPRALPYDDVKGEFTGGDMQRITSSNYEKALRNLWKAELEAPFLGFQDAAKNEVPRKAAKEITGEIAALTQKLDAPAFEKKLQAHYSPEQRAALAKLLSVIMHGEAYALFVSASLIPVVKGTGPKLGLSMQVMEEAKHFIVMRALVKRLDKIYPQRLFDRMALEGVLKADPLNRLFGMNVVVESIATNFFSTFQSYPGLEEVLTLFHLDESRHSAFPQLYVQEAPLSAWVRYAPTRQIARQNLVLPLLGLVIELEDEARTVGLDVYEFGARCVDKIVRLAERSQFHLPMDVVDAMRFYNLVFNLYRRIAHADDFAGPVDYSTQMKNRIDKEILDLEREIFGEGDTPRGPIRRLTEPIKAPLYATAFGLLERSVH